MKPTIHKPFDFFASETGGTDWDTFYVPRVFTRDELFAIKRKVTALPGDFLDFDRSPIGALSFWRGKGKLPLLRFNPEVRWHECKLKLEFTTRGIPVSDFTRLLHDFVRSYPERQRFSPSNTLQLMSTEPSAVLLFLYIGRGKEWPPSRTYCQYGTTKFGTNKCAYRGPWKGAPKDFIKDVAASSSDFEGEPNYWELTLRHDEEEDADLAGTDLGCRAYQWAQEHLLWRGPFEISFCSVIKGKKGFKFLEKLRRGESEIDAHLCDVKWGEHSLATFEARLLPNGNRLRLSIHHPDVKGAVKAISAALGLKFRRE